MRIRHRLSRIGGSRRCGKVASSRGDVSLRSSTSWMASVRMDCSEKQQDHVYGIHMLANRLSVQSDPYDFCSDARGTILLGSELRIHDAVREVSYEIRNAGTNDGSSVCELQRYATNSTRQFGSCLVGGVSGRSPVFEIRQREHAETRRETGVDPVGPQPMPLGPRDGRRLDRFRGRRRQQVGHGISLANRILFPRVGRDVVDCRGRFEYVPEFHHRFQDVLVQHGFLVGLEPSFRFPSNAPRRDALNGVLGIGVDFRTDGPDAVDVSECVEEGL